VSAIIDGLRKLGEVTVHYRGRGMDESLRIVFEVVAPDGEYVAVVWHADHTGSAQDDRLALAPDMALGSDPQLLAA
jgi:hypothetical protein